MSSPEVYIHRVKVLNLPKHEMGTIKKFFDTLDLHRFKKAPKWDYAYFNFETEEAARLAMTKLEGKEFKKHVLATEYAKISQATFRSRFEAKKDNETKTKDIETRSPAEMLADQVTPLYKMSYENQVIKKHKSGSRQLNSLRKKLNNLPDLTEAGREQIAWTMNREDPVYQILEPIQSPLTEGYRTKCEFTIGKNLDGEKTVGFLLGQYRDGVTSVLDPQECLHVSEKAKEVAKAMEDYIRDSEHEVYDRISKKGVWRTLMTKTQRTGDIMIMIQLKTDELSSQQIAQEKENITRYWNQLKKTDKINTTTLMLQTWDGDSNGITDKGITETLIGDGYVYEELLGCRFRISSSAFFQVNTPATELLYSKCAEWCSIDKDKKTTLLDLCCGTGTIGITMANSVDKVIGIEMIPEAIVDAKANAEMNSKSRLTFMTNLTYSRYYQCTILC
ncbi:unnamed protein product [Rhizopus stolonifer]